MTDLAYSLPAAGQVRIAVYDVTGRAVAVLADEMRSAGNHGVRWDGRDARGMTSPAGVYIMRLEFAGQAQSRKMVLAP
jgi:flagellar hook assembly protein FlgD